ncbi:hypothetical protein QYM36_009926, partial [Artemia franciscana]
VMAGIMDLSTETNETNGQDLVISNLAAAIAQSFPDAKMIIINHQTASGTSIEHFKSEHEERGSPDWVWVNHPVSSTTEVSHPEVMFCWIKPFYNYENSSKFLTSGTDFVHEPIQTNLVLVTADSSEGPDFIDYFSKHIGKEVVPLKVTHNEVIAGRRDDGPCTIQIGLTWEEWLDSKLDWFGKLVFETTGCNNPVSYEPGDDLGVLPENTEEMVLKVIQKLRPVPSLEQAYRLMIVTIDGSRKECLLYEKLPAATIVEWFKKFLDITTPPTQSLLGDLVVYAIDSQQKEDLKILSQDIERYEQWKHSKRPTVLNFLEEFSSLSIPAETLIYKLPLMKPCFYPIASSLLSSSTCVDLTVEAVNFITEDDSSRSGLCSMYLNQANIGSTVKAFFRSKPRFHLPENPNFPIIMVGMGKGTAPFRSFWMHRAELKKVQQQLGRAIFYGEYTTQELDLYREEKWKYHKLGVIELAPTTYSREAVIETKSVAQMMMMDANNRRCTYDLLASHCGHIYVCGDANMANEVKSAVVSIFKEEGNIDLGEAASAVENLF